MPIDYTVSIWNIASSIGAAVAAVWAIRGMWDSLKTKIDSNQQQMNGRVDSLQQKMDSNQALTASQISAFEARVGQLESTFKSNIIERDRRLENIEKVTNEIKVTVAHRSGVFEEMIKRFDKFERDEERRREEEDRRREEDRRLLRGAN